MSYSVEQPPHCDLLRLSLTTGRFVRCRRAHLLAPSEGHAISFGRGDSMRKGPLDPLPWMDFGLFFFGWGDSMARGLAGQPLGPPLMLGLFPSRCNVSMRRGWGTGSQPYIPPLPWTDSGLPLARFLFQLAWKEARGSHLLETTCSRTPLDTCPSLCCHGGRLGICPLLSWHGGRLGGATS